MTQILRVNDLRKTFSSERGLLKTEASTVLALDGISLDVEQFDTLGIVGESGCGKTTLAKIITRLIPQTSGEVIFNPGIIKNFRKDVQIVFQNPYNSLNPKIRIIDIIAEPLIIHKIVPRRTLGCRAAELLAEVGIEESALERYPREFSGGQRQRISIARALSSEPKFLILDEPISSLDLTVQAKMLDLFLELKKRFKLTYIFITHNLALIRYLANKVMVMQNGLIAEQGRTDDIFTHPSDEYTKTLLTAAAS